MGLLFFYQMIARFDFLCVKPQLISSIILFSAPVISLTYHESPFMYFNFKPLFLNKDAHKTICNYSCQYRWNIFGLLLNYFMLPKKKHKLVWYILLLVWSFKLIL